MAKAPAMKLCKKCGTEKTLGDFYKRGGARKGYCHLCKDCMKAYYRNRWRDISKPDRQARLLRYREWFNKIKDEIFNHYGRKCVCCGEQRQEFLTIDHLNGGGTKHRKVLGGGTAFFKWLRDNNYPPEYRVLCMNCNFSLGRFGYCPHERENV